MGADKRVEPRIEAKLAIRLAFGSLEEFVERWALNVSRGGLFVRTRDPKPPGTPVSIDLQIATGQRVVRGRGVVAWTCSPSAPGEAHRDPGMGIRFIELDAESRRLVDLVVATQPGAGQGDDPPRPPAARLEDLDFGDPRAEAAPAGSPPGLPPPAVAGPEPPALEPPALEPPAREPPAREPPARAAGAAAPDGAPERPGRAPAARAGRVVGIDLGTTNCCVAVAERGRARVLASRQGWTTMPSVVAFDAHGRLLVGHPAKAQMVVNPTNTVYGSKRLVGRPWASPTVQACRDRFHYGIVAGRRGEAAVRFAGREFSLQQVAAYLLGEIRQVAAQALGEEVGRAVVTVPAYYNDHQRQAVREAGELAGFHVERIVNEPTAAALAFGFGRNLDERVLVYDLGGGTFDASVVEIQGEVYEVLSTGGDTFLGGADFDAQLVDHLVWRFMEENGFAPPDDKVVWQRIRDAAEETKVALSEREAAVAHVPYLCRDRRGDDVDLRVEVSRAELEELTGRLVERSVEVCQEVLAAKGLSLADLDEVVMVGGQSRMPLVARRIGEALGREPTRGVHPDEAVAIGAALLADSASRIDSVVLIDVLPMGIGVGLPGGRMAPVIPRNARLPVRRSYELATVRDGQVDLELAVFQGDSPRVAECEYLGTVRVEGLPPAPRGAAKVAVEFTLGAEGILAVAARDLGTGKVTQARLATLETPEAVRARLGVTDPPAPPPGQRPSPLARVRPQASAPRRSFLERILRR